MSLASYMRANHYNIHLYTCHSRVTQQIYWVSHELHAMCEQICLANREMHTSTKQIYLAFASCTRVHYLMH